MNRLVKFLLLLLAGGSLGAATLPETVQFQENGTFRVGPAEFEIQHFNSDWKVWQSTRWTERQSTLNSDGLELTATVDAPKVKGRVTETITPVDARSFRVQTQLEFPVATELKSVHHAIILPATFTGRIQVDGKELKLPATPQKNIAIFRGDAKKVEFFFADGMTLTVEGSFPLRIQDDRSFQIPSFAFRFQFTPSDGQITKTAGELLFTVTLPAVTPVALADAANRGFADDPAGVRGWTGQGPGNDLRDLPSGMLKSGNLKFLIDDRGGIVVGGKKFPGFESSRTLELPVEDVGAVNLLHASAWTPAENGSPVGELEVIYADGASERIPVLAGRDCGNWWGPYHMPNAYVAWRARNSESFVGLYASSFSLKQRNPRKIVFHSTPATMWMIAGVTLSDRVVGLPVPGELTMAADADWVTLDFKRKITPGGPFDFSSWNDAPAGKYGSVRTASDGTFHFENAPEKRVRFFGPNLVHSGNFLSHKDADELAGYFAAMGYNAVRFHHIDHEIQDRNAADSLTFDPAKLDALDYLFAKMKERGVYATIDLYSIRTPKAAEKIDGFNPGDSIDVLKALLPFSSTWMNSWKEYARRFLTHKNPYTGLTWGEDPALYAVVLTNEEVNYNRWNLTPTLIELYTAKFNEYLKENNLPPSKVDTEDPVFAEFLHIVQGRVLDEQIRFIKEELKLSVPVTSLNHIAPRQSLTRIREKFDIVAINGYWDHPQFPEKAFALPMRFSQESAIWDMGATPGIVLPVRIPGKPCIMTEFNYCKPNQYRAEGGPLIGAYAALQNWDGLNRFAWASRRERVEKVEHGYSWDAVNDPLDQLSERIAGFMFRRGDVAAANEIVAYPIPEKPFGKRDIALFPYEFRNLGLITGIGSASAERTLPNGASFKPNAEVHKAWEKANQTGVAESVTGQLTLNSRQRTFAVNTPKTASVTLPSGKLSAGDLSVRNATTFQTVAASSLDEKPLSQSDSVLVFHLTDLVNTGMRTSGDRMMLYHWGKAPMLLRRGSADIALRCDAPRKVVALNADGEAKGIVKSSYRDGVLSFKADTALYPGGIMAYHLIRE